MEETADIAPVPFPLIYPVSVVLPVPPLATDNVPVVPSIIGKPVQLVRVPAVGAPKFGVVKEGELESTTDPLPVELVTPVPPLDTGRVPEMSATGIVALVDSADVPVPFTYPVIVERPVPPLATDRVPVMCVTAPLRATLP
jgi:hypothetical protein